MLLRRCSTDPSGIDDEEHQEARAEDHDPENQQHQPHVRASMLAMVNVGFGRLFRRCQRGHSKQVTAAITGSIPKTLTG